MVLQRYLYLAVAGCETAHDGQIVFLDASLGKCLGKAGGGIWRKGEDEQAGGWAVEAMYRIYVAIDLVAQGL